MVNATMLDKLGHLNLYLACGKFCTNSINKNCTLFTSSPKPEDIDYAMMTPNSKDERFLLVYRVGSTVLALYVTDIGLATLQSSRYIRFVDGTLIMAPCP